MNKFIFVILLFSFCEYLEAQEKSKGVKIFEGRGIVNCPQTILDLSYKNLEDLPIGANNLSIEILIIDNNNLRDIPNWIYNLKNLRVLSVRNNNLKELNSFISRCENLEELYLSGNYELVDLPDLSKCEKLKIIDVVGTKIKDIPIDVRMMDHLFYFKYSK